LVLALLVVATGPVGADPTPETITVLGPFAADSQEGDALAAELASFTTDHRVQVVYQEYLGITDLVDRVTGDDPPDVVITPQPATLEELAPELVDLTEFVNDRSLRRDFGDYMIDSATVDGTVLGAPIKLDLKTLVWYMPDALTAYGYAIPETFDELVALTDRMVADGHTPWCNYMESGFATGWIGTDWVEDLLLGSEGPSVYDQWVDHDVLFVDPRVETAFARYTGMVDTPGYVWDRANMLNVSFLENALPLADRDCLMHKQASFFAGAVEFFGYDLDEFSTFRFPSVDPRFDDSAMGVAVYVAAVNDRNEVRQLTRFMLSNKFGKEALAESGWLMANVRFDNDQYTYELTRSWADITQAAVAADLFRFDASDQMPAEVGAGTFWTGMADLVAGLRTIPQVLIDIDVSWPT
jgi:alpha-glucoside transport system substrate-binding protein